MQRKQLIYVDRIIGRACSCESDSVPEVYTVAKRRERETERRTVANRHTQRRKRTWEGILVDMCVGEKKNPIDEAIGKASSVNSYQELIHIYIHSQHQFVHSFIQYIYIASV